MSGVMPTVISPARMSLALASVGPPAGSGGLRVSANDPLAPGSSTAADGSLKPTASASVSATTSAAAAGSGQPRTPSPSRIAATTLTNTAPASPFTADAVTSPAAGAGATMRRVSVSGNGDGAGGAGAGGSAANTFRSVANRARAQAAVVRSLHSRPDSPRTTSGRVHHENSATSVGTPTNTNSPGAGGAGATSQRAYAGGGTASSRGGGGGGPGSRSGLTRDRSFASTIGSTTGQFRVPAGSMNGGFVAGLDSMSMSSQMGGFLGSGGGHRPLGLQPAPGTVGGIDVARLAAIQRLLDEYDSDDGGGGGEAAAGTSTSPRGGGGGDGSSSYRNRSESLGSGGDSARQRERVSDSGSASASGLRKLVTLRSRKDMQHWQPSVSTVKGSLEEHQQRLRERADVTQSLKRWADTVLEDARKAAGGGTPTSRESDISRASSVRFKDLPSSSQDKDRTGPQHHRGASPLGGHGSTSLGGGGGGGGGGHGRGGGGVGVGAGEFLDPEQELDDEEERRLEALMALPPNPRGLGAQLRAHFMGVVEEEVNRKFESMRSKWEEARGIEAEELRELREAHKELRRTHMETKDALDKANTRLDIMRLQMKSSSAFNKAGKEAAAAVAAGGGGDGSDRLSTRGSHRPGTPHESTAEGKSRGGGGGSTRISGVVPPTGGSAAAAAPPSSVYGIDDELHDKLRNIGSRRPTEPSGGGELGGSSASAAAAAELQQQLRAHADAAMTLNRKLQDAEQQLAKLKLDKTSLEQQLTAARARGSDTGGGGGRYDADVQVFKLKQDKAALEQQLAAATRKAGGKGGVTKGGVPAASARAGSGRAASGKAAAAAGGAGGGAGGGSAAAAAARAADLGAECERLQVEAAAARREAASSSREAVERRMELNKAQADLAAAQNTVEMALQQIAGLKEALAAEKERGERAAAAAAAAEAAQKRAETSAAAANSAAAAALIKRSAATGEVQELLLRLEKERDAATAAAEEARERARELSNTLAQRTEEVMTLRDQLLQRQMDSPAPSLTLSLSAAAAAAPAAPAEPPPAPAPVEPAAAAGGGGSGSQDLSLDPRVTAAAVAAMQSLGVALRPSTAGSRRRPTSALGPGGASGGGAAGLDGAVGVAAAAAAAAALVPAVLETLRQRVPEMVMALEGDLAEDPAAAAPPPPGGGGDAAADAAAAAAAAPVIATAFVELLRGELLHGGAGAGDGGGVVDDDDTGGGQEGGEYWEATAPSAGGGGQQQQRRSSAVSAVMAAPPTAGRQLLPRGPQPFRNARLPSSAALPSAVAAVAANGGEGDGTFAGAAAAAAAAAAVAEDAGGGGGHSVRLSGTALDGVTFHSLGVRDAARGARRSVAASPATFLTALHESSSQPAPLHPPPLPHHTPYFEAAAAAVAAAAADLIPQTVSVPVHHRRHSLVSSSAAAASRRRKTGFAQLHSSYFSPSGVAATGGTEAAAAEPPPPDSDSAPPTPSAPPEAAPPDDGADADADAAASPLTPCRVRVVRSAGMHRGDDAATAAAVMDPTSYGTNMYSINSGSTGVYVDPELASVLHVERVSAAAARAAGAGRGAISPEALGPSLRDRALSALQAPEPLPPPQSAQRPQSAAVRTLEAARQHILHSSGGGGGGGLGLGFGGRLVQSARPGSLAVLPPVAGALPAGDGGVAEEAEAVDGGGAGGGSPGQQQQYPSGPLLMAGTGVKIRAVTANPQKGVQLPARPRAGSGRQGSSARGGGLAGRSGGEGVRFEDEEEAAAAAASVSGRLIPGYGLSTPIRELQLHVPPGAGHIHHHHRGAGGNVSVSGGAAATYLVSSPEAPAAPTAGWEAGGEGGSDGGGVAAELPSSGPELAALARGLMAAQEKAVRELEEAMATRRELAKEVMTSRQQWLDEARRARALEAELEGVREVLVSLGIGGVSSGGGGGPAGEAAGGGAGRRGRGGGRAASQCGVGSNEVFV